MKLFLPRVLLVLPLFLLASCATHQHGSEYVRAVALARGVTPSGEIILRGGDGSDRAATPENFEPPVEITIVAKTDSTNLRLCYAADQVIFNWELDPHQLRVDGGPADGRHRANSGLIPVNRFVTIKWMVTSDRQAIFVDGERRFEHFGDYSRLCKPVSVFTGANALVTVRSLRVRQLDQVAVKRRTVKATGVSSP